MLVVDTTPVVGLPQHRGWSQVFQSLNRFVVISFSISGDNAHNVGRDVLGSLQEKIDTGPLNLDQELTPQQFHDVLKQIVADVQAKECMISLAGAFFLLESNQVILAGLSSQAVLKREGKVGVLLDSPKQLQVIQGSAKQGDAVILSTDQATSVMEDVKQRLSQGYELDSIAASLVPGLHSLDDSSRSAIAMIELNSKQAQFEQVGARTTQSLQTEGITTPKLGFADSQSTPQTPPTTKPLLEPVLNNLETVAHHTPKHSDESRVETETQFQSPQNLQRTPVTYSDSDRKATSPGLSAQKLIQTARASLASLISRKDVYVTSNQKRKVMRVLVLAFLVLVPILVGGGWWWQRANRVARTSEELLAPLAIRLEEVQELAESDPLEARQQAEALLNQAEELEARFINDRLDVKKAVFIKESIADFYDSISGQEQVSSLPSFFDLRNIDTEFISSITVFDGEVAYFVDAERARVISLDIDSKSQSLYQLSQSGEEVGVIKDVSLKQPGELVLLSTNGLFELDLNSQPDQPVVIQLRSAEDQTNNGVQVGTFGDFIYVANDQDQTIYQYVPADEGYADPRNWVTSGGLPIQDVTSLFIDGNVWLTNSAGEIVKMRSGQQQSFELTDVPNGFNAKLSLFSSAESDNLYLLESDNRRMVVVTKEGQFLKEISSDTVASATNLFVDAEETTTYFVSGAEIFAVELGLVNPSNAQANEATTETAEDARTTADEEVEDAGNTEEAENAESTDSESTDGESTQDSDSDSESEDS